MPKRYAISVHDMNRKKLCDLYDSTVPAEGEAMDVEITKERNGWKEIHFTMPYFLSNGEENFRCQYLQNELLVRLIEGDEVDWYSIVTPTDVHKGLNANIQIVCEHVSGMLKTRNLFGYFDDTNGIGTCQDLCEKALNGTGWVLKDYDTFYESDGRTEKVRSYSCDEKTGAWDMIQEICELFMGYPIFYGDTQEVSIRSRLNHEGIMEITFGKNTEDIERERDTAALVTRLYVQGDYTDEGYVGIDDAKDNELHLNFICNFDYYRELGLFTDEHETALQQYLNAKSLNAKNIQVITQGIIDKEREFGEVISTYPVVFYSVSESAITAKYSLNGATDEQMEMKQGDTFAAIKMSGEQCISYEYVTMDEKFMIPEGTTWLAKFVSTINGKLMTAENFANTTQTTLENLQEEQDKLNKDSPEDDGELSEDEKMIEELKAKAEEYRKQTLEYMAEGVKLAKAIITLKDIIKDLQEEAEQCEEKFAKAMGTMLRDGYWSSDQYIPGQEDALYSDALDISKEMAHPQYKWKAEIQDLSFQEGWEEEAFHVNQTLRIFDEVLGLKQYAYVESHTINPRREWENTVEINTDELGLASRSLANILTRITDMAQLLKDSAAIYKRASAIGDDGSLQAKFLEGMIDISKNKILSVGSNWYTDDNGNIIFVALDESSAMMLTGMGFMVANGKNDKGEWNWRTFGTGDGFTADLITTGFLSADRIMANSITANHLAADVGESLDLSSNKSIKQSVTENLGEALDDAISDIEIGGTNLADNSESYLQVSDGDNTHWVVAEDLETNTDYTLSIREIIRVAGTAYGVTWCVINQGTSSTYATGTLNFTYSKQVVHFRTPAYSGNWALYLYSGIKGSTSGVTVQFNKVKLEVGMIATSWSPSPDDTSRDLAQLSGQQGQLDSGMEDRVKAQIESLGLDGKYATLEEFLDALDQISAVRSSLEQANNKLNQTFSRLDATESDILQIFSSFVFGTEDDGTPYLDMSTTESSLKMRLTNTKLSFMQGSNELAYFSDNKLYVTRMEAVEQISIGTPSNGYQDIVTTPGGVGLQWRTQ